MTIDWDNPIWKNDVNLKNYIKTNGNSSVNLNGLTIDELLSLAKSTEKALALIDIEEEEICARCEYAIDDCICYRCRKCYSSCCNCPKEDSVQLVVTKTFYFIDDDDDKATADVEINILKYKLKIKLFILSLKNNDFLLNDVTQLLKLILKHKFSIDFNKNVSFTIPQLFSCLSSETLHKQMTALKYILDVFSEITPFKN